MNFYKKNQPKWTKKEMIKELMIFLKLYKKRPIKTNRGGMRFSQMFAFFFILKKIKPKFIIESGIFKGQSTWLIEKALPKSKILSIDPNLNNRKYISKKVNYSEIDFKNQSFINIPKNTLVFFDDHQNHMDRLKEAKWFGIKHIVFEDNYPVHYGDFYTLKHAFSKVGFNHHLSFLNIIKTTYILIKMMLKKKINNQYYIQLEKINSRLRDYKENKNDFKMVQKNINIYYEFPPIIKLNKEKWNKGSKKFYKTKKPILNNKNLINEIEFSELQDFNFLTYINLN